MKKQGDSVCECVPAVWNPGSADVQSPNCHTQDVLLPLLHKEVTQQKRQQATNMAPEETKAMDKPRGLKVQTMAYILAVYHLVVSIILFIEYSVQMDKKKNFSVDLGNFNNIASTVSSFLLLVVLFLISLSLLIGVRMNRGSLVIPFLALQTMDFLLSCMLFFTSEMPSKQETSIESNKAVLELNTQSTGWRYFQMGLGLIITCSCYVEFPTYLNMKPTDFLPYFSVCMSSEKYIKEMIIFLVLHGAVILYKAFMICYIWRFFKGANGLVKNQSHDKLPLKEISKTTLPSYKEAIKDLPPPYATA